MLSMGARPNMLISHLADYGWRARPRAERTRAGALAGQVRLRARSLDQPVAELSGGNQQKVVFARALAGNPRLLLLEEPTRGVDVLARAEIHALIRRASAQGCAVLIASTDLPELVGLADRFLYLDHGRQAALEPKRGGFTPADLLARIYSVQSQKAPLR
jgi:ABC-type sugar transport system ATPase subunit